jgi:DNA modification methylase
MKATIYVGDVLDRLSELPDGSVRTCITSPPYWGLRDYGTATWLGGDEGCDHLGKPMATKANINRNCGTGNDVKNATAREFFRETCAKCGATRKDDQLGLEATPEEYVANMVAVFREVWRVLADDGTVWLNIGDTYATGSGGNSTTSDKQRSSAGTIMTPRPAYRDGVIKPKDLVGIPWRVAFALQADGWYLRQDIIWAKPNPMPESVRDRCTKSHEYVFLLSKSPRYYYDHEAIKEPSVTNTEGQSIRFGGSKYGDSDDPKHATKSGNVYEDTGKRNKRDVWTIATKPFKGAHFAVMPEALVEPCVLAGSAEGDTVLDPFTGSGTVAVVALRHGRNFVGTELNPEYAKIAYDRITGDSPLMNEVEIKEEK